MAEWDIQLEDKKIPYSAYTPNGLFTKAMFDFDFFGISNFKFSGTIRVSVSDGFSNDDYYYGPLDSIDYTMDPYSNEIDWSQSTIDNIQSTLSVLSSFANLPFSSVANYDTIGASYICSPADVGSYSDINICFMNANSSYYGISSLATDDFG